MMIDVEHMNVHVDLGDWVDRMVEHFYSNYSFINMMIIYKKNMAPILV
jgi:hypothetical protein